MNVAPIESERDMQCLVVASEASVPAVFAGLLNAKATLQIQKMFRDPRILEPAERAELAAQLRSVVDLHPQVAELRVLLAMALCVDLKAQSALEELRLAVELSPDSFIARLKYGELLMRLRICKRAAEETHRAAQLAVNAAQSEMARRQGTTIRIMLREGVERAGYTGMLSRLFRLNRRSKEQTNLPVFAGTK